MAGILYVGDSSPRCGNPATSSYNQPEALREKEGLAPRPDHAGGKEIKLAPEKEKDNAEEYARKERTAGKRGYKLSEKNIYIFIILL